MTVRYRSSYPDEIDAWIAVAEAVEAERSLRGSGAGTACTLTALPLDEMLSGAIAGQLRARDLDVVAVVEDPRLVGMPDEQPLTLPAREARVLVTPNLADFAAIATGRRAAGREHAGLFYVTSRAFPQDRSFVGAIVSSLLALHEPGIHPRPGTEIFLRRP